MKGKEHRLENLIKEAKYRSTFQLTIYLHQFLSVSLVKQGYYYITATLIPKILISKSQENANTFKTYSSQVFHIKYNNHIQLLNQLFSFTFYIEEFLPPHPKSNQNKLLLIFGLMKCLNDNNEQPERKLEEQYQCVNQFTYQLKSQEQLTFIQYFQANFQLPFAASVNGAIICLITGFQTNDNKKLFQSQNQLCQLQKIQKVKNYFQLMGILKKLTKKHRFASYSVQKTIQDAFLGFHSIISIPNGGNLSPTKSLRQQESMLTQNLEYSHKISQYKLENSSSSLSRSLKINDHDHSSIQMQIQEKLTQINQRQCTEQQFMNYLAYIEYQDKKLHHLIMQINNLGLRNKQVIKQLQQCIAVHSDHNKNAFLHKVHLQALHHQYIKKRNIIYGQKITTLGKSLNSASQEAQIYLKNISSFKSKQKEEGSYFTKMPQIFNLIPASNCQIQYLRYDRSPFIFYSFTQLKQQLENLSNSDEDWNQNQSKKIIINDKKVKTQLNDSVNNEVSHIQPEHKNIFILAHGYQANGSNMQKLKINLKKIFNKSKFLVLKSYSQSMDRSLQEMGKKAAGQIEAYFNQFENSSKKLRIIMVGHSMGGIILRASFEYLSEKIIKCLHTYISFATPHLGYLNCKSLVTGAGIKLIQSVHPSTSLKQLSNKDKSNIKQTFIYKLANIGSLRYFENIIVFSSVQDKYVPWNSARIQLYKQPKGVGGKNTTGGWSMGSQKHFLRFVENEMMNQILGIGRKESKAKIIHRFQVDFNINHINLDTMIGRTSHVAFLGSQHIMSMVFQNCLQKTLTSQLKIQTKKQI